MKIVIAGNEKEVAEGITVQQLIETENVESPEYVTVSLNDEFVKREEFQTTKLNKGDSVEFIYFMGGGSGYGIF